MEEGEFKNSNGELFDRSLNHFAWVSLIVNIVLNV